MTKVSEQRIVEKLRQLPKEWPAQVGDFVDFLAHREADKRGLTHAAKQLATAAIARVWDTLAAAEYDLL